MWCIELGVSEGGGWTGCWGGGGKEVSTASHNWSKVLMGERSHPPCEGWQGNVAGGNGFSQSAETEGRSLGAALPRGTVRLPQLCQRFLWEQGRRDTHCVCVCLFSVELPVWLQRGESVWLFFFFLAFLNGMDRRWHFWLTAALRYFLTKCFTSWGVKSKSGARPDDKNKTPWFNLGCDLIMH